MNGACFSYQHFKEFVKRENKTSDFIKGLDPFSLYIKKLFMHKTCLGDYIFNERKEVNNNCDICNRVSYGYFKRNFFNVLREPRYIEFYQLYVCEECDSLHDKEILLYWIERCDKDNKLLQLPPNRNNPILKPTADSDFSVTYEIPDENRKKFNLRKKWQ